MSSQTIMVSTLPHPTLSYSSISSIQSRAASLPQSEPEIARETADVKAKRLRAATQPSHIATKNSLQKHWTKRSWSLTSLNSLNESSSYRQAKGAWYYWWLKFRTSWNCSHYENTVLHISVALSKPPCQWSRSRHLLKGFSNKLHKVLVLHCFAPQKSRKPFFATKKNLQKPHQCEKSCSEWWGMVPRLPPVLFSCMSTNKRVRRRKGEGGRNPWWFSVSRLFTSLKTGHNFHQGSPNISANLLQASV